MNSIEIYPVINPFSKNKWRAEWEAYERDFITGAHKISEKHFSSIAEILEWARENYRNLDWAKGGGFGVGVMVYIDDMVIAEFWDGRDFRDGNTTKYRLVYARGGYNSLGRSGSHLRESFSLKDQLYKWITGER